MTTDSPSSPSDKPARWETLLTYAVWLAAGMLYAPFFSLTLAAPFGYFLETCDSSRSPASYAAAHLCVVGGVLLGATVGFVLARKGARPKVGRMVMIVGLVLWGCFFFGAPAVDNVRIAAKRVQCTNHLRSIGDALHQYHDTHDSFPTGTVSNPDLRPEQRLSWCIALLPYLDQQPLYDQIDQAQAWDSVKNGQPARVSVAVFHCPANWHKDEPGKPALSHYVGITGVGPDAATLPKNDPRAGFFGYDRVITFRDILDGSANTLVILDTGSKNGPWAAGGEATLRPFDPATRPYIGKDRPFGGLHRSIGIGLFADGSARSIWGSPDEALEAAATISGGERNSLP
jgi:hypothetical protein